nr:HTH-type transcriptional regulator BetI [Kibdelosporangium sp. MJ126-NF4]CTQ92082.1 HTH-type transcriptional regulator BetI [Kibdelosporangium sp. MJ126-NF4]
MIAQDGVRGLRVEKLAAEAGVSTALIYYHFKDRAGILHAALEHINHRAENYTEPASTAEDDPLTHLRQMLLLELQDADEVRENSIAWGELRASAVFNPDLREALNTTTKAWNTDIEALIRQAQESGTIGAETDPALTAEHLTTLVEGLSERWHSGSITLDRAREVLTHAVASSLRALSSEQARD